MVSVEPDEAKLRPEGRAGNEAGRQPAQKDGDGLPTPRRYFAIGTILATLVLVVLDGAIANVALPSIARALAVSEAGSVWVVTAYQLAVVVTLLPAAALGESIGCRRVYVFGIALFTAASAFCTFSTSLTMLAIGRFVQGIGGGSIMALGAMMLRFTYPQRLLGRAIAWNAMAVALSSAAGPAIGGAILSVADWPWLFAVNLPIGIAVLVTSRALPSPGGTSRRLDGISVAINGAMFLAFVLGMDRLAETPSTGAALVATAAVCLALLIRRERAEPAPLVPVDLFADGAFRIAAVASVCCFAAQMMSYVALPFYLQHQIGLSVVASGAYMMPWPLAIAVAAPLSGRLADRFPGAWICAGGAALMAVGLVFAGTASAGDNLVPFIVSMVVAGLGFGFFQTANNRTLLLSAPKARSGAAGGVQASARLAGQTLGAIAMSMLFQLVAVPTAPRTGLAFAAVCAVAAGAASLLRTGRGGGATGAATG